MTQAAKKAVIYARFSSELQKDRSIDDQVALCREFAKRQGWVIVDTYADRAVSGASIHGRDDYARMCADAEAHRFEIVLAEDIDRLARKQADSSRLRERLEFLGIELQTVADGKVTKLSSGLRGLMSELFLDNLRLHIKRGLDGVVRDGRYPGGRAYGYRPTQKPGVFEIVPEEAEIIRRIFGQYAAGNSPRDIAAELNRDRVAPPRGNAWNASTINGNSKRAYGILHNTLYVGQPIWNKSRKVLDPDTGRRVNRPNPESEWVRIESPHLRIVADDVFASAQARKAGRVHAGATTARKPKRMLSGLLRCGACGSGMSIKDHDHNRTRIICTRMKESGACDHRRAYYLNEIERIVVDSMRQQLGSKHSTEEYVKKYNELRRDEITGVAAARVRAERRLSAAQGEIDRTVKALVRGTISEEDVEAVLPQLRAERDRLLAEVAATPEPPKVITLHPASVKAYLADLARLDELINEDLSEGDQGLAHAFRRVIQTVTIIPSPAGASPEIEIRGHLATLIAATFAEGSRSGGSVVPQEGFEPPTPSLRMMCFGCRVIAGESGVPALPAPSHLGYRNHHPVSSLALSWASSHHTPR
jgi:site-specific DNA recombinase